MLTKQNNWKQVSWYCPNCGNLLTGHTNAEGNVKATCCLCHAEMALKVKGRRHNTLEIYAPKN